MIRENLALKKQRVRTHTPLRRWWLATFLIVMMMPMIGKGQSTCLTAVNDSPGMNTQETTLFFSDNYYWLTFVGESAMNYYIQTNFVDSLLFHNSMQISLYRGSCNDLTLIKSDSIPFTFDSMQTGTNYYVKIQSKLDSVSFRFFSVFVTKNLTTNCDSTECDILRNGNFTFMDPNVNGAYDPFWADNWICRWGSIGSQFNPRRHPCASIDVVGAMDLGFAFMWTMMADTATLRQYEWNEVISQVAFIPQGTYDVSLAYKKTDTINLPANHLLMNIVPGNVSTIPTIFNGTLLDSPTLAIDIQNIDNLNWEYHTNEYTIPQSAIYTVEVLPFNTQNQGMASWVSLDNIHITPKPTAQILTSYCKPVISFDCVLNGCHTIDHIIWNFGDGTSYTTAQGQTIGSHEYVSVGSFTVTATIFYRIYNSPAIANITQITVINTGDQVENLDIEGNRNACDSITSYSTINSFTSTNCTWTISPANTGTIIANNNHTITINWHDYTMTNGQPVTLTVNDDLCSKSINIWKCCKDATGIAPMINDETITSNLSGGTYYLNGTITIDGGVTITNTVFNMAPEAKIVVKPPTTFNVNLSTIKAGCNYMWDGIYTKSRHSYVNTQSSTIQDAQNAIVSENGAYVSVLNTLFNLNKYGIKVQNSIYDNPLNVSNCNFYSTTDASGSTPRNLISPLNNDRGSAGILLKNVSNAQIGDINKATKNKFSYTYSGIYIENSSANIYNNNFINLPATPYLTGVAIRIYQQNGTVRTVNIGGYNSGNNIYTNLFSNCNRGIFQQYQTNLNVLCDTFINCAENATEVFSNNYGNITFRKNRIQNTPNGLLINDFMNTRLVVDSNSIYNVTNGIIAQNATSQECYGATIRKNTLTGAFKTGIKLSHVKGRSLIPTGPPGYERQIPYIYGNTITFGSYDLNGSDRYDGVSIYYCYDAYIEDNIINTPTYTVANLSQGLKLSGLNINTSPKTTLCSNTITNLGMGIRFSGLCTASPIKSNTMNNNYYGVRLENATIGNQGNTSSSVRWVNRNWWNTPFVAGRYRVQGSVATATTWTYDYSQITTNYTLLSSNSEYSVSGAFTSTAITSPVPQTCPGFDGVIWIPYSGGGGGGGDAMINGTQSGELSTMPTFTADIEENQYYQASAFYANAQPENLNMSVSEDAELTDNPIQTTSIPQFDQVNKLISANRIDEAIAVNDAIAPKNLIEKNHKIANGIYLQSWAKGRFDLTSDEKSTLLDIANQSHIQGGYGVITAWVMLNRVYIAESVKPKSVIKPFGIHNCETTIYPNPAREQLTVSGATEVAYVVIYDLQGRELIKTTNVSGSSMLTINTSKLTKGIYLITLIDKELSVIVSEKMVIE